MQIGLLTLHLLQRQVKLKKGCVEHLRFGKGEVTEMEGKEPNIKATIQFDQGGEKQLC